MFDTSFVRSSHRVSGLLLVIVGLVLGLSLWASSEWSAEAASCGAAGARCEMVTLLVNSSGRVVSAGTVNSSVYPRAVFDAFPAPSGTVSFEWFANGTCEGASVATSSPVPIVGGVAEGASFAQTPRKAGGYAVVARYSGDSSHPATVGECRGLTVGRTAPQLLASGLTLEAEPGAVSVGGTTSVTARLEVTSDTSLANVRLVHSFERARFAVAGELPAGCAVEVGIPDAEHDAVVCRVPRVQMGPAPTAYRRAFAFSFTALASTDGSMSSQSASATFEFEGVGQATPFALGPRNVELEVLDIPRLSLPAETTAQPGDIVRVPIFLTSGPRAGAEFRLTLTFDSTLLVLDGVEAGSAASTPPTWSPAGPGRASVVASHASSDSAANATLAVARFRVLGGAGRTSVALEGAEAIPQQPNATPVRAEGAGGIVTVVAPPPPPPPQAAPEPVVEPDAPEGFPTIWDERLWTPEHVSKNLGWATLLGITLTGLAEIFNATVEENRPHFSGWWRRRAPRFLRRRTAQADPEAPRPPSLVTFSIGVTLYLLAASVLFAFLEPEIAIATPVIAVLAAGFAILATGLASQLPRWLYVRRLLGNGDLVPLPAGQRLLEFHADFWTLLFALICVGVAYGTAVRPGYAYGIVGVLALSRNLRVKPEHDHGQLQPRRLDWLSMVCLFAAAVVAWVGYSFAHAEHIEVPARLLEKFWILGAETVALGLIPLSFLPGHSLWRWSRVRWSLLWGSALFMYLQSVTAHATEAGVIAIALTLASYGALTVVFWLYFKSMHDEETCDSCRIAVGQARTVPELTT